MQNFVAFLFVLSFLFIHGSPEVITDYPYRYCSNDTVSPNATFLSNLNLLTSALSSNASHQSLYKKSSVGRPPNPTAYGDFQCRGDLNASACRKCVATATANSSQDYCPLSLEAVLWFDECFFRYSNNGSFFSAVVTEPALILINGHDIEQDVGGFDQLAVSTLNATAANASSVRGRLKFATREANFGNETLYTLAQCTGDLSRSNCGKCLRDAVAYFPNCCSGQKGARVLFPSCTVRYELYSFYAVVSPSSVSSPPASAPVLPSPAPAPVSPSPAESPSNFNPSPDSSPSPPAAPVSAPPPSLSSSPSAPPPSTAAPPLLSGKGRATMATVIGIIAGCLL